MKSQQEQNSAGSPPRSLREILNDAQVEVDRAIYATVLLDDPNVHGLQSFSNALRKFGQLGSVLDPPNWRIFWAQVCGCAMVFIAVAAFVGWIGFNQGVARGDIDSGTVSSALNLAPAQVAAWASIMRANDPVLALSACKKKIFVDKDGQRFCKMPIWLDYDNPPPPIVASTKNSAVSGHTQEDPAIRLHP